MTTTTPTVGAAPDPTPGPGERTGRALGQGGAALAILDLARAFDWLGSDGWTAEQAAERWPALTAAAIVFVAGGHNLLNYVRSRRFADELRQLARDLRAIGADRIETVEPGEVVAVAGTAGGDG